MRIFVDSGALMEKEWCVKSGLAFWGKNCLAVSPSKGSFFNIGLMLADKSFAEEEPPPCAASCGECGLCVEACPTRAISGAGYSLDYGKCVSYLTQKRELAEDEARMLKGRLMGCDACQSVCPFNRREGAWKASPAVVSLDWVTSLSDKELKGVFGKTSAGWRAGLVRRNAEIALKRAAKG